MTVCVIDFVGQAPDRTCQLRRNLSELSDLARGPDLRFQYFPCFPSSVPDALASEIAQNESWLRWDLDRPKVAPLLFPSGEIWRPSGPVVALVGGEWNRLHQAVVAAHYGKLFEWDRSTDCWQLQEPADFPPDAPGSLAPYLERPDSFSFQVPLGARAALKAISQMCPLGCLIVAHAEGWMKESDLRRSDPTMINESRVRRNSLPVNFDWLAKQCASIGAISVEVRISLREVCQLVLFDRGAGSNHLATIARPLESTLVTGAHDLADAIIHLCAEGRSHAAATLLQQTAWDPAVFTRAASDIAVELRRAGVLEKLEWTEGLRKLLGNLNRTDSDPGLMLGVAKVALACSCPELAWRAQCMLSDHGPSAPGYVIEAQLLELTGQPAEALEACEHALARGMQLAEIPTIRDRIRDRLAHQRPPWRQPYSCRGSPLILEPLDHHHAEGLCLQFREPQAAAMTGLPQLKDVSQARQWIDDRVFPDHAAFAAIHRQFGLVGYCDLSLNAPDAFLCFWVGVDFQGRGYSKMIVSILCELAFQNNVRVVWSSAFDDNVRSLQAMRAAGFKTVGIRATSPHDERTFVYLAREHMSPKAVVGGLVSYCERINTQIKFPKALD